MFEINDNVFEFFKAIEMKVRKKLHIAFDKNGDQYDLRESIADSIAGDNDIQFFWTLLSVDIETEAQATKVLKQIIGIWLTIRGHSIAGTNYKGNKPAKRKGLHNGLKRATQISDSDH